MKTPHTTVPIAVIGVGALGKHHLKWLANLEHAKLVGIYDLDQTRAASYAKEYNTTAFGSLDEVAKVAKAVSIVTPTSTHYEVASFFISRGIHCLIEKPVTASLEEARRLQALAKSSKTVITVGQIERFNPALSSLKPFELRPSFIEAHRLAAFDPRGTDVAVILDLMIHDIDLCLHLIKSNIVDIQASAVAVVSEQADIANARLTFANGAVANLTASRISLKPMRKMRIFQQSGYFSLDFSTKQADVYRLAASDNETGFRVPLGKSGRDIVYNKFADTETDMLAAELKSFVYAIATETAPSVSLDEATEALRVALEIERIGRESIARHLPRVSLT